MKTKETLTRLEVDGITNSWMYKAINNYLSSDMFVNMSSWHGHPDCGEDPLYMHARLYALNKDNVGPQDPSNVIVSHIFSNVVAHLDEVQKIFDRMDNYNIYISNMLHQLDNESVFSYNDKVPVDCWHDLKDIMEQRIYDAIDKIYDEWNSFNEKSDIFEGATDITWLTRALSYSMLTDIRWRNYFNIISFYKTK